MLFNKQNTDEKNVDEQIRNKVQEEGRRQAEINFKSLDKKDKEGKSLVANLAGENFNAGTEKYLNSMAMKYYNKLASYLKELKDNASQIGVEQRVINKPTPEQKQQANYLSREEYIQQCEEETKELENGEFMNKSLPIYIVFALALCTGDLLMGEYLAKQVLLLGDVWWAGPLLGVLCIGLGITVEIVLNILYSKKNKLLFDIILCTSFVFSLLMFVGMGLLRSNQLTGAEDFSYLPLLLFFIGMSAAAPTALGCTLFIIQKKMKGLSSIKKIKKRLAALGLIQTLETEIIQDKTAYVEVLYSEYHEGYSQGLANPPTKAKRAGSLVEQFQEEIAEENEFEYVQS